MVYMAIVSYIGGCRMMTDSVSEWAVSLRPDAIRYLQVVYGTSLDDAEDVYQTWFLYVLESPTMLDLPSLETTTVAVISGMRWFLSRIREQSSRRHARDLAYDAAKVQLTWGSKEQIEALIHASSSLREDDRELMIKFLQGASIPSLAAWREVSIQAIYQHIDRIIRRLENV
jgi:DNA-directed RNA polymerase specialized sigma24 family protein